MHRVPRLLFVLVFVASLIAGFPGAGSARTGNNGSGNGGAATQSYIVAFAPNTPAPAAFARGLASHNGFKLDLVYQHAIKGFAAQLNPVQVQILSHIPGITIQPDEETKISSQTIPTGIQRVGALNNATANINGVDNRVNVNVAVLDTGIDYTHPDLNVVGGYNCTSSDQSDYYDYNGHGTHVAGTIAAVDNNIGVVGMAPGAKLWSVRVFNGSGVGRTSWLICGLDWITQNANTIQVANYSGGQQGYGSSNCNSDSLHVAVCSVVNAGIPLVVAAGNGGTSASNTLPAAYPQVITVGAIVDTDGKPGGMGPPTGYGSDDTRASFSNYGPAVTLYAPGVNILSTWPGGGTAYLSGTSQAAPHVTGAAALYLADHPGTTPAAVKQFLINTGEAGSWGGSWNQPLVDVGDWGPPPAIDDVAVTAVTAPNSVGLGATVPVTVTVKNNGNQPESVSVSLTDNSNAVGTAQTISSLAPGASQDVPFNWTASTGGNHSLAGSASISATDATPADNTKSITVSVVTPVDDVAVTSVTPPSTPFTGIPGTVTVTVQNNGNQPESVSVSLTDNSTAVGTAQTISLNPGASQNVGFSWTPSVAGSHTLVGTAAISATDATPSDNTNSATVTVTDPIHDVAVTNVSTPGTPTLNVATTVTVTVQNNGNQPESVSVSLTDNSTAVGTAQTISLNPGSSQDVTFNWTPVSAGSHTLAGAASISATDANPADNTYSTTVDVSEASQAYVQNVTLTTQRSGFTRVLSGSVSINSTAGPVANATVSLTLTGPGTNSSLTATTDANGNATFTAPARRGTYTVTVTNVTATNYIYTPSMNVTDSASASV